MVLLALASPLALAGCAARPRPSAPGYAPLLATIGGDDAEARTRATLDLRRHDSDVVRARLRTLLTDDDVMVQNAAARALVALGEEDAAAVLIANLDRDRRTYMVTDALHHLRALYGTDRGYDPNRGYVDQTEAQERWWAWWTSRGFARLPAPEVPGAAGFAALHEQLVPRVEAYLAPPTGADPDAWARTAALWRDLADLAPSREPAHVRLVARAFGAMAERWPAVGDLWNNFALASLNAGAFEDAERAYREALALEPEEAFLHNDLGILLEGLGRLAEAEAAYRDAIRLDPEDDVARSNLGDVLAAEGRRTEAVAAYREAERLAPEKWYYHRLWIARLGD